MCVCVWGGGQRRGVRGGLESVNLTRRRGDRRLLRGERMRSGRRRSKINRGNLHSDREISLTMRALVTAKCSEVGGCLGGYRLRLDRGKSWGER